MEGKYTKLVRENLVELGALLFFVCCIIAGMALLTYFTSAPSGTAFAVRKQNGAFVITHRKQKYQFVLPPFVVEQPDSHTTDFYSPDHQCRLTVAENKKQPQEHLASWVEADTEQWEQLTRISQDMQFLNAEQTQMFYRVQTFETGKTSVYYEDKGDHVFEMRMFGEAEVCYETFESYVYNLQSIK